MRYICGMYLMWLSNIIYSSQTATMTQRQLAEPMVRCRTLSFATLGQAAPNEIRFCEKNYGQNQDILGL